MDIRQVKLNIMALKFRQLRLNTLILSTILISLFYVYLLSGQHIKAL